MICKYCELIHSKDESYPLREATRDLESDFPRCNWHWRYTCDNCGKPTHFNGASWCESTMKFICSRCSRTYARGNRLVRGEFWAWNTYYIIQCSYCDGWHPSLDRLEFDGQHPWQLHPDMLEEKKGLSDEIDTAGYGVESSRFFPEDRIITDKMVGEAWDRCADLWLSHYSEYGDANRQYVIDPAMLRILGPAKGKRILDAGCGNGYLCRLLSKKGALMVGVDVSKRAIELAESFERKEPLNIEYHVGSICSLPMRNNDMFDAVVSNLVLQDLQNLDKALEELYRVLKPKGRLVFSIMHPCFSSPPVRGWARKPVDSQRKEDWLYWKVDRYFDRSIEEWRYFDLPPIYSFHRTLSDYVKALTKSGFIIEDVEEPMPKESNVEDHYREFGNEYDRIPLFLIITVIKKA